MSDDLISRSWLLEQYGLKDCTKYGNETAEQQRKSYGTMMMYEIAGMIEDAPTTYDVEKAIEQLEENAKYFQSEADELAQKGDWGTATDLQGRATAYRDAAEIVKSGGVSND